MVESIVKGLAEIFLFFGIGALASRLRILKNEDVSRFSNFSFNFLYPPLIFSTIVKGLDRDSLLELWPLPVAGFLLMAGGAILGFIFAFGMSSSSTIERKRTFRHICAVNNFGFLPIILLPRLWGDQAVADLFVLNMGSYLASWTIGIALLGESHITAILKKMLSPTLIALVLALASVFFGLEKKIPIFFVDVCSELGASTVQLMLVLVGATLYQTKINFRQWDLWYVSILRVLVIPGISLLIIAALGLDFRLFRVVAILAIMPAAATSAVMTRTYGGDPEYAASVVLLTTLLSIGTIPLFSLFIK
ncbi:MAG: AEC family transporter [Spirochaetales bacterium]|nr:AEC family transporter [Spirochaetales bacterium]